MPGFVVWPRSLLVRGPYPNRESAESEYARALANGTAKWLTEA